MPSLGDVANEVKSLLEDIKANTSTIKGHTNAIKNDTSTIKTNSNTIINQLNQIDNDIKNGFTNLAQGFQILITLGNQANELSYENNEQNRTIICWLNNIANTLCDVKHNTDREVALQKDLSTTVHHIDDIDELVNSREAMDIANRKELQQKIEECCPPEQEVIRPCFTPCVTPKPVDYQAIKTDWRPVKYSNETKPVG
jgi:hypothetical protein